MPTITSTFQSLRQLCLCGTLAAVCLPSAAEVYRSVDEKGNITFTDHPAPQAELVPIQQPNTIKAIDIKEHNGDIEKPLATEKYRVSIISPQDQATIPNRLQPLSIQTEVKPSLRDGDQLRLILDDREQGVSLGPFTVEQLSQGPHTLVVEAVGREGNVISRSAEVHIFARQPGQAK